MDGDGDDDGGWCFPAMATVLVKDRGTVALKDLKIDDHVLVDGDKNHYEPVYSFGHKDEKIMGIYLQITTASGAELDVSKDHLVFASGKGAVPASHVRPGDKVFISSDLDSIRSIRKVTRRGAYAPLTPSGTIVINGIKTSSFVALQDSPYLRIGGVSTGLSFHWLEHTFELPHRLWCSHVTSCTNEEYTMEGISKWAEGPYKLALWFLKQNGVVMAISAIPICVWLWLLALVDLILENSLATLSTAAALVCWNTFVRIRMTTPRGRKTVS